MAGGAATGGLPGLSGGNLEMLRNSPRFQQLRQLVQTNPQLLEPILQSVSQNNPAFASLISQNPDALLQLLTESGEGAPAPPAGRIQVTPEENEAIGRVFLKPELCSKI